MKNMIRLLPFAALMVCGSAALAVAANNAVPVAQSQADCYGTYEEGLAEGRIIRQQLINEYGENTQDFNDAITIERDRALEQFRTVSRDCRQYWRGLLDGL